MPNFVLPSKTSYELITGKKPKYSVLRNFSCLAYVTIGNSND